MGARQEPTESIQQYLDRFNQLSLQVEGRTDSMVISAFINGLKPGNLHKNLLINPPMGVKELMDRVHTFAKAEDTDRKKRDLETRGQPKKKEFGKPGGSEQHPRAQGRAVFDRISKAPSSFRALDKPDSGPPQSLFTPLNRTRAEILAIAAPDGILSKPNKMKSPPDKRNINLYCRFHEDHGHDTEQYFELRREIEAAIKKKGVPL